MHHRYPNSHLSGGSTPSFTPQCMNLANQTCTWPCDPNERPCSTVEAAARLSAEGLSERWTVTEELEKSLAGDYVEKVPKLVAKVELPTFAAAAQLAARVAALAEAEGHFPDVRFGWQYLELRVFTHVANGLCLNDFILVAKLDELLRSRCAIPGYHSIGVGVCPDG